jgi:hypothetical protein
MSKEKGRIKDFDVCKGAGSGVKAEANVVPAAVKDPTGVAFIKALRAASPGYPVWSIALVPPVNASIPVGAGVFNAELGRFVRSAAPRLTPGVWNGDPIVGEANGGVGAEVGRVARFDCPI